MTVITICTCLILTQLSHSGDDANLLAWDVLLIDLRTQSTPLLSEALSRFPKANAESLLSRLMDHWQSGRSVPGHPSIRALGSKCAVIGPSPEAIDS